MRASTIENELANVLFQLSFGKLTFKQAQSKSKEMARNFDIDDDMLAHKGINWYAKEVIKKM